jgi:hypothetical protein
MKDQCSRVCKWKSSAAGFIYGGGVQQGLYVVEQCSRIYILRSSAAGSIYGGAMQQDLCMEEQCSRGVYT